MEEKKLIKSYLINCLKEACCLWSYDNASIHDMPDDILVELVMIHLDIQEINLLFRLFPFKKVKGLWIENVLTQGERYYTLNCFLAWYYFNVKKPRTYIKSMSTRQLNKWINYGKTRISPAYGKNN